MRLAGIIFALFFAVFNASGVKSSQIQDEEAPNSISFDSLTPSDSSDDFWHSLTYEKIFNLFELKYFKLDISKIVEPEFLVTVIVYNFTTAFQRSLDIISKKSVESVKHNRNILYNVMKNRNFMKFLGYENCFRIMKKIFHYFHPVASVSDCKYVIRLISIQLNDFLEVVLAELTPRYDKSVDDPSFDIKHKCEIEYPAMILLVERTVKISYIISFDIDLLRTIMQRYSSIWLPKLTAIYMDYAVRYIGDNMYTLRELFTVLVKIVPDCFVSKDYMNQYKAFSFRWDPLNFGEIMANMAPIFRALMFKDDAETRNKYLEMYRRQISLINGPCLNSDGDHLTILESFIRDSKFSFTTSVEMFQDKANLLESILSHFFGLNRINYYSLALICIRYNYLAIFEVLLKYFGASFTTAHAANFIKETITNMRIFDPLVVGAIILGYLDIEDQIDGFLRFYKNTLISRELKASSETEIKNNARLERIEYLQEWSDILKDCPIKTSSGILVGNDFVDVPWPCPEAIRAINSSYKDSDTVPKLFNCAQVILCKRFSVPFWSVSVFESSIDEAANWSETVGFMNLAIETMGSHLGYKNVNFFKFIDSTEYLP